MGDQLRAFHSGQPPFECWGRDGPPDDPIPGCVSGFLAVLLAVDPKMEPTCPQALEVEPSPARRALTGNSQDKISPIAAPCSPGFEGATADHSLRKIGCF